ncbi:hypothetical protein [Tropicibacter sp. S64]|uniref:hypothetical protein n=1 Tax=Tropicibacter sp. S64 TaxID=3415122 RepID=UPI003C7DBC95
MDQAEFNTRLVAALERWQPELGEAEQAEKARKKAESDATAARIKRIEKVSAASRSNWFWFFGVLAYAVITIMGLEDRAFFTGGAETKLPILNFSVDFTWFVVLAPALIAVVYGYLHNLIEQLWQDLADLPPTGDDGLAISAQLPVWLLIDFALSLRGWLRPKESPSSHFSPLGIMGSLGIALLIWAAGPAVVAVYWAKAAIVHAPVPVLLNGAFFFYCLLTAWLSASSLVLSMLPDPEADT